MLRCWSTSRKELTRLRAGGNTPSKMGKDREKKWTGSFISDSKSIYPILLHSGHMPSVPVKRKTKTGSQLHAKRVDNGLEFKPIFYTVTHTCWVFKQNMYA